MLVIPLLLLAAARAAPAPAPSSPSLSERQMAGFSNPHLEGGSMLTVSLGWSAGAERRYVTAAAWPQGARSRMRECSAASVSSFVTPFEFLALLRRVLSGTQLLAPHHCLHQPTETTHRSLSHHTPHLPPNSRQIVNNTYPPGLGEPLNAIVSADSDPAVLVDSLYDGGFQNYML